MKAIVFDVGGVFRDSSEAVNEGMKRGFQTYNIKYPFQSKDPWHLRGIGKYNNSGNCIKALLAFSRSEQNIMETMKGDNSEHLIDKIVTEYVSEKDSEIIGGIRSEYKKYFYSPEAGKLIHLYPGVKGAIDILSREFRLALFTNTRISSVKRDLADVGLGRFENIIDENSVKHKKPSGEGILKVCENLGEEPKNSCYVGDSVVDILASRDAGCNSIALTCDMGLRNHLERETPDYIFNNLLEMAQFMKNQP